MTLVQDQIEDIQDQKHKALGYLLAIAVKTLLHSHRFLLFPHDATRGSKGLPSAWPFGQKLVEQLLKICREFEAVLRELAQLVIADLVGMAVLLPLL